MSLISAKRQQDELPSSPQFENWARSCELEMVRFEMLLLADLGLPSGLKKTGRTRNKGNGVAAKRRVPKPVSRRNALSPRLPVEQINVTRQ